MRGRDGLTGGQWAGSGWPHIPPVERQGLEPHRTVPTSGPRPSEADGFPSLSWLPLSLVALAGGEASRAV